MFLIGGKDPIWRGTLFGSALAGGGSAPTVLAAPTRQTAPTVAGTFQVGQTLTIGQPAVYSGNPSPTISYSWQMRPNGGGKITTLNTGASLTLTEAHVGMQIRLQDMASNSQGSTALAGVTWLGPVAAAPTGPTQQAARTGATGRGAQDFIGSYDIAEAG